MVLPTLEKLTSVVSKKNAERGAIIGTLVATMIFSFDAGYYASKYDATHHKEGRYAIGWSIAALASGTGNYLHYRRRPRI